MPAAIIVLLVSGGSEFKNLCYTLEQPTKPKAGKQSAPSSFAVPLENRRSETDGDCKLQNHAKVWYEIIPDGDRFLNVAANNVRILYRASFLLGLKM